ncbi:hypothetical protein [Micromonospora sp. 4G55]|uniref:hypothetical protein n=1 Tax=Micromonospora sp. 4G55 TaxID=2806102 RepID=UPI001A3ADFFC|nr:hypothetical protein [Micromonospora sp. 4G55]MBM0256470.1 hypothetical protein [Micromonospora sp. 4G55]
MSDGDEHGWQYAPSRTLAGALQRGLGRGAHRAMVDPAAPDLVRDCLRRDRRFWWVVDERAVYLARLVRDLALPLEPILHDWYDSPDEEHDDNAFTATLEVVDVLGRAGVEEAVEGVRRYVREGPRWNEALTQVARTWPEVWWDDLYPAVMRRPDALAQAREWRRCLPWRAWADRDPRVADAVRDDGPRRSHRPGRDEPSAVLLEMLRDRGRSAQWADGPARTGLPPTRTGPARHGGGVGRHRAGRSAEPAAARRRSAGAAGRPRVGTRRRPPADLADPATARRPRGRRRRPGAAVRAGLVEHARRPVRLRPARRRAGPDRRSAGPGGPAQAAPALVQPALLRTCRLPPGARGAGPAGVHRRFAEGLWDCEADVRLLSARRVAFDGMARERLRYLRDDPIETAEVRAAAAERLEG